ncbi:hypothetical protein ACIGJO_11535 [Streptomyces sp. NPDC079020]
MTEETAARAIDTVVAATAPRVQKPVVVLTSDTEDMLIPCGTAVAVVEV